MLSRVNIAVFGLLVTCILFYTSFRPPTSEEQNILTFQDPLAPDHEASSPVQLTPTFERVEGDESIYQVQNDTLGFQEIYMISLPSRSDKRDAFAMQAALSGIAYTQMDGVDGHQVPEKALPYVWIKTNGI